MEANGKIARKLSEPADGYELSGGAILRVQLPSGAVLHVPPSSCARTHAFHGGVHINKFTYIIHVHMYIINLHTCMYIGKFTCKFKTGSTLGREL